MNIKSLLLGSAAALAVVSGAQAADAIVAAEPEPAEYVKVCDAFGSGYFYIPGTETCLKIGGRVRIQQAIGKDVVFNPTTTGRIKVSAMSDSEFGAIEGYAEVNLGAEYLTTVTDVKSGADVEITSSGGATMGDIYIAVGGLKAGVYGGLWDNSVGENPSMGDVPNWFKVSYSGSADTFSYGVQIDELEVVKTVDDADKLYHKAGLVAKAGVKLGGLAVDAYVAYDVDAEVGNVKIIGSADVGPGTFTFGGAWFGESDSGTNAYDVGGRSWTLATAYAIKASDKITIAPDFEYFRRDDDTNGWTMGALTTYTIAPGLTTKLDVTYNDAKDVGGWLRFERTF